MYWRWSRIPELADLSPEERKHHWEEARRDPFQPKDLLWFALVLGIAVAAGTALSYVPKDLSIWMSLPVFLIVVFGVCALSRPS